MKRLITFLTCMVIGSLAMTVGAVLGIVEMFKPVKYLVPILFVGLLVTSCGTPSTDEEGFSKSISDASMIKATGTSDFYVERLGDCQYLLGYRKGMHKGDCDNPIHPHNQ